MSADGLGVQGASASGDMIVTKFARNILGSVEDIFKCIFLTDLFYLGLNFTEVCS